MRSEEIRDAISDLVALLKIEQPKTDDPEALLVVRTLGSKK
jgi:hypothetical protein